MSLWYKRKSAKHYLLLFLIGNSSFLSGAARNKLNLYLNACLQFIHFIFKFDHISAYSIFGWLLYNYRTLVLALNRTKNLIFPKRTST